MRAGLTGFMHACDHQIIKELIKLKTTRPTIWHFIWFNFQLKNFTNGQVGARFECPELQKLFAFL